MALKCKCASFKWFTGSKSTLFRLMINKMKNIKTISGKLFAIVGLSLLITGCSMFGLDVQKNYDYQESLLDNQIHMTAWDYLKLRAYGSPSNPTDTVFRWMKKAIDYCGIDTTEYMKSGRTFIFLQNDALKKGTTTITGGFFFDFPIVLTLDPVTGLPKTTTPAKQW